LRAQITDLLNRIQTLQQQIATQGSPGTATPTPTGGAPAPAGSCPRIGRVLKLGSSGDDVSRLQQFLALDPSVYPEGLVTGYYGALTEAAIKRFQCKNKIVCDGTPETTGYGVTGPRTAAILALQCPDGGSVGGTGTGGTAPVSGFIKVTPTSGVSPLNVSVEATVNTARACQGNTYEVHFGDSSAPATVTVPQNACAEIRQVFTHTYNSGGTYQVLLRSGTHQVSATVSVTQGSGTIPSTSDSFSGSPTSGSAPLTVNFTGLVNVNGQCNAGPFSINFGDGQSANITTNGCAATNYVIPHAYSSSGTFTARLYRGNPAVNVSSVSVNVTDNTSGSGGSFSVSGAVGGNPLAVRALFDLASSCSRYDLNWGDGTTHATQSEGTCSSGTVTKDISHTYTGAGTYTITLKRGASLQYTDTASITIVQ
ncbi:MAG: peptidoglycan-binding protein, partial [Patescibacteria group bacterium]